MLDNSLQLMNDDQGSGLSIYSCKWNKDIFWVIATSGNYTEAWELYFSKRESITSKMSSEKMFSSLLKCSRFSDITAWDLNMHCVRNCMKFSPFLTIWKQVYTPEQNTYVNELQLLWKKCLGWKQYILSKHSRFGMKMYKLCESSWRYVWNFAEYTGNNTAFRYRPRTTNFSVNFFGNGKPSVTYQPKAGRQCLC
jgi:hypothetical protein